MKIKFPFAFKSGIKIINHLKQAGYESYFVGGSVRDLLLNRLVNDVDIATAALPSVVVELFDKVIPVGIEHGTVIVRMDGQSFEVTTFRRESTYSDHRRPDDVIFVTDLELDLARRDFTMNALALNEEGKIIDLYSGMRDINNKLIRAVGNAEDRFEEDALRMIRAIRFVSQLDFQIEGRTLGALIKLQSHLKYLAIERLAVEFEKTIQGEYYVKAINYLIETKIYRELPLVKELKDDLLELNSGLPFVDFSEFIAFAVIKKPSHSIRGWVKVWKLSNQIEKKSTALVKAYQVYEKEKITNSLLYHLPETLIPHFISLVWRIDRNHLSKEDLLEQEAKLAIRSRKELKINGTDLMNLYPEKKPGAWIESYLNKLEYLVVENKIENDKIRLKEWIRCNPLETN